jgi:fatty acid desaturase
VVEPERLRAVQWKDLVHLGRLEVAHELSLSLPWLLGSCLAAAHGWLVPALACSFLFFLTGLRQVHNGHHDALGVSRAATEWVLFALSLLMLGSMHAVQVNHLRHHRHCLRDDDVEALSPRMPGWRAILVGPLFPLRLPRAALAVAGPRQRRWIRAELAGNLVVVGLVVTVLPAGWARYHVMAMAVGQCLTAFFAVWTVHHGCEPDGVFARTIRTRLKAVVTYNMFYHVEHHLFPAVPTSRLPVLARRLDVVAPELAARKVF